MDAIFQKQWCSRICLFRASGVGNIRILRAYVVLSLRERRDCLIRPASSAAPVFGKYSYAAIMTNCCKCTCFLSVDSILWTPKVGPKFWSFEHSLPICGIKEMNVWNFEIYDVMGTNESSGWLQPTLSNLKFWVCITYWSCSFCIDYCTWFEMNFAAMSNQMKRAPTAWSHRLNKVMDSCNFPKLRTKNMLREQCIDEELQEMWSA